MESEAVKSQKNEDEWREIVRLQQEEISLLREKLNLMTARLYGSKSERSKYLPSDSQPSLFDIDEDQESPEAETDTEEEEEVVIKRRKARFKAKKLPDWLPREQVLHELSGEDLDCGCGQVKTLFGKETTEEVHYQPPILKIIEHIYCKYACLNCKGAGDFPGESTVVQALRQPRLIPGGMAGDTLLAHLMTAKFVAGLPFERVRKQMARLGMALSRTNMSNWSIKIANQLQGLWGLLLQQVKNEPWLQMDETTVLVLKEQDRENHKKSHMWVIYGGPPGARTVLFHYAPSRSRKIAEALLGDYQGIVQTDGYRGYLFIDEQKQMVHAADWSHTRRKFADVLKGIDKNRVKKKGYAYQALKLIKKLYAVEKTIREEGLSIEDAQSLRNEKARPVIDKLHQLLCEVRGKTPKSNLLGRAVEYALERWDGLKVYLDRGDMPIDTNGVEGAIRPFVVGRKNWLYHGSPNGARSGAIFYSLVETAKANGWRPDAYLLHLFRNLPTTSQEDLHTLLPTVPPPEGMAGIT